jgi:hypothetical protein
MKHWERYPPLPRLVAWFLGLGKEPEEREEPDIEMLTALLHGTSKIS